MKNVGFRSETSGVILMTPRVVIVGRGAALHDVRPNDVEDFRVGQFPTANLR